ADPYIECPGEVLVFSNNEPPYLTDDEAETVGEPDEDGFYRWSRIVQDDEGDDITIDQVRLLDGDGVEVTPPSAFGYSVGSQVIDGDATQRTVSFALAVALAPVEVLEVEITCSDTYHDGEVLTFEVDNNPVYGVLL